jgi:hypothetical protein
MSVGGLTELDEPETIISSQRVERDNKITPISGPTVTSGQFYLTGNEKPHRRTAEFFHERASHWEGSDCSGV